MRNPRASGGLPSVAGPNDGSYTLQRIRSDIDGLAAYIQSCVTSFKDGGRSRHFAAARPELSEEMERVKRACASMVAQMRRQQEQARKERERKKARDAKN